MTPVNWKPDTCECEIEVIDWDTAQGRTIKTCSAHQGLIDDAHMAVVYLGENKVKNLALEQIKKAVPKLDDPSIEIPYVFEDTVGKARSISFELPTLTSKEKADAETAIATISSDATIL